MSDETQDVTNDVTSDADLVSLESILTGTEVTEIARPHRWRKPKSDRLVNRSRRFTGFKLVLAYTSVLAFLIYTIHSHITWGYSENFFLALFFSLVGVLITYFMLSGLHWRSFAQLPVSHGRVVAVVPVYNESTELVHATVRALLRQTILPDKIHVVDDGSTIPIETFDDPLVEWHRTENQGKRHAQVHALSMHSPREFDFIMTVDSDSVCDDDALEQLLRSMSDERVQAATGMIFVRNWNANFLTRLTDINVVTSCLLFRMARSILGIVSPTSGALALYRSEIVYDNIDDYVASGTAGDDRRLSFYALLRGQVVGVTEAVVATQLPDKWKDCFWQRMRWSKSAFLGLPFVLTNMRWLMVIFYVFPLVFMVLWPFIIAVLAAAWIVTGDPQPLTRGLIFWVVCSMTQTWIYAAYRPGFTLRDRLHQWLLSPFYPILGLFILRPAAYFALTKLKDKSWHTRGLNHAPAAAEETVT